MGQDIDWVALISRALEVARQGTKRPVPGAKLRVVISNLASDRGLDFGAYLREHGQSFIQFLDQYPQFKVVRRLGTDMLVGLSADEFDTPAGDIKTLIPRTIRQDFYNALIDFHEGASYGYDVSRDIVVRVNRQNGPPENGIVAVPTGGLPEQLEWRREFARKLSDKSLEETLENPTIALSAFRSTIRNRHLEQAWHNFKCDRLHRKIIEWAATNRLEVREGWFANLVTAKPPEVTMTELLQQVAGYLTDEELRDIRLPLRAVHAFWLNQIQRSRA